MAKAKAEAAEPGIVNQMVPVDLVSPHPQNYNRHDEGQIADLRASLRRFGQVRSVVVQDDGAGGFLLVAGHGVHEAAKAEGFADLRADVIPADWTPARVLAYLAADNELARRGLPDEAQLAAVIEQIQREADEEMARLAAGGEERLAEILAGIAAENAKPDPGPQIDRAEELQEKWRVQRGQVWQIGRHRLMCGDSTNAEDVGRLMDGANPLLMVTDPPYGVEYDPNWRNVAAAEGKLAYAARRVGEVPNDDRIDWSEAFHLFPGDVLYSWSPPGDHLIITGKAIQSANYEIRNQIIWAKPHFPISRGHYTYRHEPCWYAVKKGSTAHWIGPANENTVWEIALDKNVDGGHSTQKPVECFERPIRNHKGDVYDPFIGSGTALVAAEQTGRIGYGMEICEKYVAVSLERLTGLGLEAHLVEG